MAPEPSAILVFDAKRRLLDGRILQARIWLVPKPVAGSRHRFKYSLFFGRPGERVVLYDNERMKGDHRHDGDRAEPYRFETVEKLVEDFKADVRREAGRSISLEPGGDDGEG